MDLTGAVTLQDVPRWNLTLAMLSMERCIPFFPDMGLPVTIAADPMPFARAVQACLRIESEDSAATSTAPEHRVHEVQRDLEALLNQVAALYDDSTGAAFASWCGLYVADARSCAENVLWERLLRLLCDPRGQSQLPRSTQPAQETVSRMCAVISSYLDPQYMQELRERLRQSRAAPPSEWDEWLERSIWHASGDATSGTAIESALELVENISGCRRMLDAWRVLFDCTSLSDRDTLLRWAREEARGLGIPEPTTIPSVF